MQPLLTIQDLSAGYGGKTVIRDISLTLMPGEILGVVGESGSGKTTLLKAGSEVKGLRTDIYTGHALSAWDSGNRRDAETHRLSLLPGVSFFPPPPYGAGLPR